MIFNSIDFIKKLSVEKRLNYLGDKKKNPAIKKEYHSNIMLNPLRLKHINKIDNLDADMITLNLEDAIAPSRKKEALYNIALFLSHLENSKSFIIVRTNPLDSGGREEIEFLNSFGFDAIRVAKIKTKDEIEKALEILDKSKELHISLETKEAFSNLTNLKVDSRFTTVNLGILDLLTALELPQSLLEFNNPTIEYILTKFLIDAKIAGLKPISFMFQDYKDTNSFKKWCEIEKELGFKTKACMGPLQVEIANRVFGYGKIEIEKAKYIKRVFEESSKKGEHGFMDSKYGFIDEPIYRDALLVLGEDINI